MSTVNGIIIAALLLVALPAVAEETTVLTPTTLYTKIEALEKRASGAAARDQAAQKRIAELEAQVVTLNEFKKTATYRLNELERKVSGMQKQVTILHAKTKAVAK